MGDDLGASWIYGIHPVEELLDREPHKVERLFTTREKRGGIGRLLRKARVAGVPVSHLPREILAKKCGSRAVHQGIAAQVAPIAYRHIDALFPREEAEDPAAGTRRWVVALDQVEDPRNLGAVLRTCAAVGASGVVVGGQGGVGLTPAVAKTSAGAVHRIPVAREPKLGQRLANWRRQGYRILGLTVEGQVAWDQVDLSEERIIFVAGGEHRGLRPSVAEACDELISIPLEGSVESLNVAVALAVLLFEAVRQRRAFLESSGVEPDDHVETS